MPEISYDWVWFEHLRDDYLTLSERDRADLALRVAFISANPWPDFSSKTFFDDLPPDLLQELVSSGGSWHLIIYADDQWVLVYEVVQPLVIVFYAFARLS
jgi:hypothetical protein